MKVSKNIQTFHKSINIVTNQKEVDCSVKSAEKFVTVLAPLCRASNEENLTSILFSMPAGKLLQFQLLTANLFHHEFTH